GDGAGGIAAPAVGNPPLATFRFAQPAAHRAAEADRFQDCSSVTPVRCHRLPSSLSTVDTLLALCRTPGGSRSGAQPSRQPFVRYHAQSGYTGGWASRRRRAGFSNVHGLVHCAIMVVRRVERPAETCSLAHVPHTPPEPRHARIAIRRCP